MKAAEFNRLIQARREDPEQLAALETLYLKFIHRAGRRAVTELRSSAQKVTVGAGWQPPPEGVLFDPDSTAARSRTLSRRPNGGSSGPSPAHRSHERGSRGT